MSFVLKEGFSKPYVGININSKDGGKLALADYNQLQLQLSGQKIKDIVVYLVVKSKNKEKEGFENIHFGQNIEVSNSRTRYSIPLNLFKTPDWWYDVKKIVPNQTYQLDLENVTNINFATNLVFPLNVEQSLQIQSIEFSRNNKWTIIIMLISELLIIAILVLVHYFRFPNNIKEQPLIIAYRPVEVENKKMPKSESFFDYISNNFNNSELNLNLIASATGFNQRYISESISQKFNCNVKTYINQIRIKEAQRLLTTTDLNISEIAYKVGFNSPNNFNRVFKKLTGNNPSDFVQNKE
jgi:YesN/AraC family two-component response regulator